MEKQFNLDVKDYVKGVLKLTNVERMLPKTDSDELHIERISTSLAEAIFISEGDVQPENMRVSLEFWEELQGVITITTSFLSQDGEHKQTTLAFNIKI